ncbi:MAG: tetratricopeptide repeat protein [Lewinellaceae bacterium]|nr:tetratricopeptide repeat protein [Saprospiraceae bacterium]MCB9339835.1 tetratricopeptide repeat protein [Lewinellaceae bacterium]
MMNRFLLSFFAFVLLFGCTPKTTQQTTETKPTPKPNPTTKPKSICPTFDDAPNPEQALENFVLYRDFLKANDWKGAFELWQKVYKEAPAADGQRSTVFTDGIKFYEHFMAADTTKKEEYVTKVFKLYDDMEKCYPDSGYVTGLKAFDYFFKYPDRISKLEQYKLFKKSIEMDGGEPRYFVLNPFTALLVDLTLDEKVPVAEAQKYQKIIRDAIEKGQANCQGKECENWAIIAEYAPARLEALESIEGFYNCTYYKAKYYDGFDAAAADCETLTNVYSRLKWGQCPDTDAAFAVLQEAMKKSCDTGPGPLQVCNELLRDGKYRQAADCYEELLPKINDNAQKAQVTLIIAKIYYAYLKNFSRARQYAQQAAKLRPGWGDPYMLIGTMYASSGPICGPGRGWDSQIVTWPAIDKWQYAKSIDAGVANQANKLIGQYTQYMPSVEDGFQRGIKEGSSFYVGCWIQENTTVRFAK